MQEEKFISEFWKSNERSNFSKEATVLFFYLIYIWKNENKPEKFYVHPASLLCKVRGFTVKDVLSASKELQERNYISFTAPEKDWCSGEYSLCMERAGQGKDLKIEKRIVVAMGLMFCGAMNVEAQSVTYRHDAAKMNQITVGEIGSGSLTPSLYYQTLHKSYSKSAASKNKLSYRTLAGVNLYNQVDEAEALDSAMVARAKIEALNMADRSGGALDVAWAAEGGKITDKMGDFERNINRILQTGGNSDDQSYWKKHYQMFQCAIRATQDTYMPNAQRKKQYLRIYTDVARKNEELIRYLVRLSNARKTSELLAATNQIENRKAQVVAAAMGRWRSAGWTTVDGRE